MAVILALASACRRGPADSSVDGTRIAPPDERPPLELSPIPPPPPLQIAPGTVVAGIPAGPLAVVVTRPQGRASGYDRPGVTFNKPIAPLGDTGELPPPATIAPALPGRWMWLGSNAAEFVLDDASLPYGTTYTVTVNAALRAIDGEALNSAVTWSFTTLAPAITSSEPEADWAWLPRDAAIDVVFNQPVVGVRDAKLLVNGNPVSFDVDAGVDLDEEDRRKRGLSARGRSPWGTHVRHRFTPKSQLPAGASIDLDLSSVRGGGGSMPLDGDARLHWRTAGTPSFTTVRACTPDVGVEECAYGPLVVISTNAVDTDELVAALHLDPPVIVEGVDVDTYASVDGGVWHTVIPARLRPGTTYRVRIDAGVHDVDGAVSPAFTNTLRTGDVAPALLIDDPIVLLESSGDGALPVESANITHVQARVVPVDIPTLARELFAGNAAGGSTSTTTTSSTTLAVADAPNVSVRTPLPLLPHLPAAGPRLFVGDVRSDESEETREPRPFLGQITDLAAHGKLGATSGVVWVTSLARGTPVAGAKVRVWDRDGVAHHEATTDADGIAHLPGLGDMLGDGGESSGWATPFALVSAEKDGDTGVTLSQWTGTDMTGDLDVYGVPAGTSIERAWDGNDAQGTALVFTDRGIYRPGDKVLIKGIVRVRKRGALQLPLPDSEMKLTIESYDHGKVADARVALTRHGTFSTTITLPPDAGLGYYDAVVAGRIGRNDETFRASFRVEEYRAPQFRVDVGMPADDIVAGTALRAHTDARYLFGAAMTGARVTSTITRETTEFQPDALASWSFGPQTWWWDDGAPASSSDVWAQASGEIGSDGAWHHDFGAPEATAGRTWRYTLESEVVDVNRQSVANRGSVVVHPASLYAGLRVKGGFGAVGTPMSIEAIASDLHGALRDGVHIDVTVQRRSWKSTRRRDPKTHRYELVTAPEDADISTCALTSSSGAPAACTFTPSQPGLHLLQARLTDDQGRVQTTRIGTYVAGPGWVSWQRSDDDVIELIADQKRYAPGDVAHVLVKSPWPSAEALFTVEREGVLSSRHVHIDGAATTFDVPIDEAAIPNVFASVVLVRGRVDPGSDVGREIDPGRPQMRVGWVKLPVERAHKRLQVGLDVGAREHAPGESVTINVHVRDHAGAGVPSEVTLWAVDEGVLRLTGYEAPDPLATFLPERGLSVRFAEPLLHLVRRQAYGTKGGLTGSDGGGIDGFRSTFRTTALFVPALMTDEHGDATTTFKLPDDLTTFRVMAVATTTSDRFGVGRAELVVRKPLLALPALPRLARVGDVFEAGVVVHAQDAGDVRVTAQAQGLTLVGAPTQTVSMQPGVGREVRFSMRGDVEGEATVRIRVAAGTRSDGVELKIPVHRAVDVDTVAIAGFTEGSAQEALALPAGVLPDVGGIDVTLGSTALAGLQQAMQQLVEYPHGCLEQLSSRLVPFLALRELQGGFGVVHEGGDVVDEEAMRATLGPSVGPRAGVAHPDDVAKATIARILALQGEGGGFRYWSDAPCEDPWASSYATLALGRAKELRYDVPAAALSRAQRYLVDVLGNRIGRCGRATRAVTIEERIFAGFVLARTGSPRPALLRPLVDEVSSHQERTSLFARAMLTDALVVGGGDRTLATRLLDALLSRAKETGRDVHFEEDDSGRYAWAWSSDVRTTALVLMTLVDASPNHPFIPKLATWLGNARQKSGHFRSTQEAAFALMALTEVTRTIERAAPDFAATVALGGTTLQQASFRGRSLDTRVFHWTMTDLLPRLASSSSASPAAFAFHKDGPGTLYYAAVLRTSSAAASTEPIARGLTVQRWFEPSDHPGMQARQAWAGDVVRVKVRVTTSSARHFVAVEVPLPAGLEPVDTSLASTAAGDGTRGDASGEEGDAADGNDEDAPLFWSPFQHLERHDDRVVLFGDDVPPGMHVVSFVARATTPGLFKLPAAHAEEMYTPEVYGRSDAGTYEVKLAPAK